MFVQAMPGTAPTNFYDINSAVRVRDLAHHHDGMPHAWVDRPGTAMHYRILDPMYELHSSKFYRDLIDQVSRHVCNILMYLPQIYFKAVEKLKAQVAAHNPTSSNVMLDGRSE
jgi:hypothetical protein